MTTTGTAASLDAQAAQVLRAAIEGRVVLRGEDGYLQLQQLWNGAVRRDPAAFAVCKTVEDIQAAVRAARRHNLPLSVRAGGHDWVGRALRDGGLVIDLSEMRQVEVDTQTKVATVAGGATAGDVVAAAAPHGLVAVTGSVGAVGMTGLTLGGGYGPLSPRFGLAVDNLLGAEVVLADGRLVTANDRENPELYWALRGGGGNFGVVTSLRIRLHPVREVLGGFILFPWTEAEAVLRGYAKLAASALDEIGTIACILGGPDGKPVVFFAPTWSGNPESGRQVLAELEHLGTPILAQTGPTSYGALLRTFDAQVVNGRHYAAQTRWIAELNSEVISALIAAGNSMSSPFSIIGFHHLHGTPTRVPVEATAFGLRREHFLVEFIASWEPAAEDNGDIHREWARKVSQSLAPYALPGGYPNILGPDEHDQIASAFGSNAPRLLSAKKQFDPDNVFSSAISLPR